MRKDVRVVDGNPFMYRLLKAAFVCCVTSDPVDSPVGDRVLLRWRVVLSRKLMGVTPSAMGSDDFQEIDGGILCVGW